MIFESIKKNKYLSAKAISEDIGICPRKVEENRAKLKKINIIQRIGPAKGGHWQIIKK
jgi:ATP-dependent DNA helicase RecG